MSRSLLLGSMLLAAASLAGCERAKDTSGPDKPNLVWIVFDALRARNLSGYGYERRTSPNLDALARRGVSFENVHAQDYKTRGSVPQYMTGRYFPVPGFITFWPEGWRQRPAEERYVAEIMRANGYRSVMFTAHGFFGQGSRIHRSFDAVNPGVERRPEDLEDLNAAIGRWLEDEASHPFFLYVHAMDTHFPHRLGPPYDRWLDPDHPPGRLPYGQTPDGAYSPADQEYLRGLYDGSILRADQRLGELLALLEAAGELERTLVLISSDHGELLAEDGRTVGHFPDRTPDEGFHVPLILAGPGIEPSPPVGALAQNVDIVPTLVDLLELETQARFDGRSLLPLLGGSPAPHEFVYSRSRWPKGRVHILRDAEAKYVLKSAGADAEAVEELWEIPDLVGSRRPFSGDVEAKRAVMRERLEHHVLPSLRAYQALPAVEPQIFVADIPYPVPEGGLSPRSAYVDAGEVSEAADDRWTVGNGRVSSCAFEEDAPPLTLTLEVPNEVYRVEMQLRAEPRGDGREGAASALRVKAQDDTRFRRIAFEASRAGAQGLVEIGEYEVDDGSFVLTLDEGDPALCATGGRLQFVPRGFGRESGITDALLERLKTLGYVE